MHYEGKLTNGTVFDSSFARDKPLFMPLPQPGPGLEMEAIPKMHVGDEWMLYVPPELGYGPNRAMAPFRTNSVLIFRVKLLGMLSAD